MIAERPDLTKRTALSKSLLGTFDLCQTKTWHSLHNPLPFVPNEKVTFGSAVDAGVEVLVKALASGVQQMDRLDRAYDAAAQIIERDGVEVVHLDVCHAIDGFLNTVAPNFDWHLSTTQAHLTATLEGLGECDGHPDIILGDNSIFDVKTSGRSKEVPSLELGFYALLAEEVSGRKVPRVGYMNYVRAKRPFWQVIETPVTDELRRWAYEKSAAYIRAQKADVALNAKSEAPANFTMTGGPRFNGLCSDCPYNPSLGGPCLIALQGGPDVELA